MEETEKEDKEEAYEIILKNCYKFYPNPPLPKSPWFLQTENPAKKILEGLLSESKNDHKKFSRKAAEILIFYKALKEKSQVERFSLLTESLEINKVIEIISASPATATSLEIKVEKSQSTKGPIDVIANLNKEVYEMVDGDTIKSAVNISGNILFKFVLDDGDSKSDLGDIKVFFKNIIESTNYLSGMTKEFLGKEINKIGKDYEIKIQLYLKLSKNDKLSIMAEKQHENEVALKNTENGDITYTALQESLQIQEIDSVFESTAFIEKSRDNCCESCNLF